MIIIDLLRLLLHPLFKWVYKYDFDYSESLINRLSLKNKERIQEMEKLSVENKKYVSAEKTIAYVSSCYKWNYIEHTKHNEPVVISFQENNLQNNQIYLTKILDNKEGNFQCQIKTHPWEEGHMLSLLQKAKFTHTDLHPMICICDVISKERKKGYAKTLLSCFIKLALEQKYKSVVGWLSYTEKEDHLWLKKFYESLGFSVYLLDNEEGVIVITL
jgi:predicted acetyltransferase